MTNDEVLASIDLARSNALKALQDKDAIILSLQPVVVVTPPPPVTASGGNIVPTQLQNMTLIGDEFVATSGWQQGNPCVHLSIPGVKAGSKLNIEFDRAIMISGGYAGNCKTYRTWDRGILGGGTTRDLYFGQPYAGWQFGYFENVNNNNRHLKTQMPTPDGTYRHEKYEFTFPTAAGKADGHVKVTIGGSVVTDEASVQMDDVGHDAIYNWHCIQVDTPAPYDPPAGSFVKVKNSIQYTLA